MVVSVKVVKYESVSGDVGIGRFLKECGGSKRVCSREGYRGVVMQRSVGV